MLACAALIAAGCGSSPVESSASSPAPGATSAASPTDRTAEVQDLLDGLLGAVRIGDRTKFGSYLAEPDSGFATRLFANLSTLPSAAVVLRAEPRSAHLTTDQQATWPNGWTQQVSVSSRLDHDSGPSTYQVWFAIAVVSGHPRLAGLTDDPVDQVPPSRPLWLTQRVQLVTGPDATVVAGSRRTDLRTWLTRAESAEAAVRKRITKVTDSRWETGLVVELPSTSQAFDQALGVAGGSYEQIAAVAWPQGPDPATAAVRVVVNPTLADSLDDDRLAVLITHEATHVLTRSATSPSPMWLVEGFADWVAFERVPAAAPPTKDLVLADVRDHGAPGGFPADADFRPDASDLDLTYGRAWLLCGFIADQWSGTDLVRLYAEVDGGTPLAAAIPAVLGVDQQTLLDRWRSWLLHQAGR